MSSIAQASPPLQWRYDHRKPAIPLVLALALALHALLLLIPHQRPSHEFPRSPLSVRIDRQADRPTAPRDLPAPAARPAQPSVDPRERPEEPPPARAEPPARDPVRTETRPQVTAELLLEQARDLDRRRRAPSARIPGVPAIPELPPNFVRPLLPLRANAFDGRMSTGQQEVLDQWVEPGGAVNAVVRLPNGDVLCGRAAAWDPMNPLFEPVAMYRPCGGGGRRKPNTGTPFLMRD